MIPWAKSVPKAADDMAHQQSVAAGPSAVNGSWPIIAERIVTQLMTGLELVITV
jgi:hypothetical protein